MSVRLKSDKTGSYIPDLQNLSLRSENVGVALSTEKPVLVVFDLETTTLIQKGTPFRNMEISIVCATKLDIKASLETQKPVVLDTLAIWVGNGDPLEPLLEWFDQSHAHVAHNGVNFDLEVLKKHYTSQARWFKHLSKMFDTLVHLRAKNVPPPLDLGNMLAANGGAKAGKGSDAPAMWRNNDRHQELHDYCMGDVMGLAKLVCQRHIALPRGGSTDVISVHRLEVALRPIAGTAALVQGSDAWREARKGRVTASTAPMLLGVSPFGTRQQAHDVLRGCPLPDPTPNAQKSMRVGSELENTARTLYENAHGVLVKQVGLAVHPEYPAITASPDGILEPYSPRPRLLEIKVGLESAPYLSNGYLIQLVVQMACTNAHSVDFMAVDAKTLWSKVERVHRNLQVETLVVEMLNEACAEAKDDEEPLEYNVSKQQELLLVLCNMRKEDVGPIVTHRPSFGGEDASSYVDEITQAPQPPRVRQAKRPTPTPCTLPESRRSRTGESPDIKSLQEYSQKGPFIAVVSYVSTSPTLGELAAVGVLAIRVNDFVESGWAAENRVFVGLLGGKGLQAKDIIEGIVVPAQARVGYNYSDDLSHSSEKQLKIDLRIITVLRTDLWVSDLVESPDIQRLALHNQVQVDGLLSREEVGNLYKASEGVNRDAAQLITMITTYLEKRLGVMLSLLKKASTVGITLAGNGQFADPEKFRNVNGIATSVDNTHGRQVYLANIAETQQSDGEPQDTGPPGALGGTVEPVAEEGGAQGEDAHQPEPDHVMEDQQPGGPETMAEDTAGVRGKDPPLPKTPSMPSIVGRASERDENADSAELHYFLVMYPATSPQKRKRTFKWKQLVEVQQDQRLAEAFALLPPERKGTDPCAHGWVIRVDDARGEGSQRVYRTWWFVWGAGEKAPLDKRRELRAKSDFVNPYIADAFDEKLRQEAGLAEEDSDDEVQASALPAFLLNTQHAAGPDRTASAPSSFRWDPSSGRPKLSLRAAVRNHTTMQDWTLDAITEYTLNRIFVLRSRVPPATGSADAPNPDELEQMGKDLFYVRGSKLKAKWKRARAAAEKRRKQRDAKEAEKRRKQRDAEEAEEEEDDDDEDDEGDEGGDAESAEAAWQKTTEEELRDEAVARWAASRIAVDNELDQLSHQMEALKTIAFADPRANRGTVVAAISAAPRVKQILERWRDEEETGKWMAEFSNPRLKLPNIRDYLSNNRSVATTAWLKLQREEHSAASQTQRATETMGSSYGQDWSFTSVPTATEAPGDHVVPVEWLSPGTDLILESRSPAQNPVNITISLLEENSEKGSNPLGLFSIPSEVKGKGIYSPDVVSEAKVRLLAKTTAFMFLMYPAVSNKTSSKGSARMSRGSGVQVYARALETNTGFRNLIRTAATKWERRVQLLNLAMQWQICNPLVLYSDMFTTELETLLLRRFKGEDSLLRLCDEAVENSVLLAPR